MTCVNELNQSAECRYALNEFNELGCNGLSRGGLMAFHSHYKLVLLAHSQSEYRELGRFIAAINQWDSLPIFAAEYCQRLINIFTHQATRRNHTNVLMHVQGYFRRHLNSAQRKELSFIIDQYRLGELQLIVPVSLLNHYRGTYPNDYLAQQRYFTFYTLHT